MTLTLAITVYNRWEMLLESFANVIDDPRISEIIIMDDHSSPEYWNKIKDLNKFNPKIKVIRQAVNRGMSVNKRDAVFYSTNEWVILFDSDNIIERSYLDALENEVLVDNIIYCPSFARPDFNFRRHAGSTYFAPSSKRLIGEDAMFNTMMNACNFVVNRTSYLKVWEENPTTKGADTIWFNYLWLKQGYGFFVVPFMEYQHRVHAGSGFLKDMAWNMNKADEIKKLIQCL